MSVRFARPCSTGATNKKEVPTFEVWFNGRFWNGWVKGHRKNKPSSVEEKRSIYKHHLAPVFGQLRINEIGVAEIAAFRASLIDKKALTRDKKLSDKTINNVLAVLSKALSYAADVELITKPRKVGLRKAFRGAPLRSSIGSWSTTRASSARPASWARRPYAAACLAGEAGLRVGEVKGLRWREDVDLIAKTITVNQQIRRGIVGTPKGRTRRMVLMTTTLYESLRGLETVREGYVIRNLGGQAKSNENQVKNLSYAICRKAGLPERGWHALRHTFGTHAALFGVNPWRLMTWMGHKRIDETLRYVHVAETHAREMPKELIAAAADEHDPDRRVLKMLGARAFQRHIGGTWSADSGTKLEVV